MDEQTRLLTEIRDLLAQNLKKLDGVEEIYGEYAKQVASYHHKVSEYQYRLGSLRTALYVVGGAVAAIAIALVVMRTR